MELDEYSLNRTLCDPFEIFVQRLFSGTKLDDAGTGSFIFMLKDRYMKEYACALKISDYINKEFGRPLEEDELIYLTIHIKRITSAWIVTGLAGYT